MRLLSRRQDADSKPKHSIKFAVCGMSHDHIFGMVGAIQRGGGVLVAAYGAEPDKVAGFKKRFPDVKMVASEDEILNDSSIQLVLSSTIPDQRAPLGVRVMKKGKDFLSDKPGATSLAQIEEIRKTIAETKRIYGILYSERLEVKAAVKAGELVKAGAIGRVIQTINIAPHQIVQHGDGPVCGWLRWTTGLVLGPGAVWGHPHRYRIAPGGSVFVLHGVDAGRGGGVAGSECESSAEAEVSGLRRHDAARAIGGLGMCGWTGSRRMVLEHGAMDGCSFWGPLGTSNCGSMWM